MGNAKKDLIIVAQSSIENLQTEAKTHTTTTTNPSSPTFSQISSASFFHRQSSINGSGVFGNHEGGVVGTDSVVIFPNSTEQYHQETSQSKSVSQFYSLNSPTSPYVGVDERDMYPVDSKNKESSTPLTKHSAFDYEGSMIASSVLGASSTAYSQKSGGKNMSRRQSRSGKNQKYKCCGCCIVELNRKTKVILALIALLVIALIVGLAIGIPLALRKNANEMETSVRVRETTGVAQDLPITLFTQSSGIVHEWNLLNNQSVQSFTAHGGLGGRVGVCLDDCIFIDRLTKRLYTTGYDGLVKVWRFDQQVNPNPIMTIPGLNTAQEFYGMVLGGASRLWANTNASVLLEFNLDSKSVQRVFAQGNTDSASNLAKFSSRSNLLYEGTSNRGLITWDAQSGNRIANYSVTNGEITSLDVRAIAFFDNENRMITGSRNPGIIAVWDISRRTPAITSLYPINFLVTTLVHDTEANKAFIGGNNDGSIAVLDLNAGQYIEPLSGEHSSPVLSLFIVDRALFTCGTEGKLVQWSINSGKRVYSWELSSLKAAPVDACRFITIG